MQRTTHPSTHPKRGTLEDVLFDKHSGRSGNILFSDNGGAYFIEYVFCSWYFRWNYFIGCVFVVWKRNNFMMMWCIIITKLHLSMLI